MSGTVDILLLAAAGFFLLGSALLLIRGLYLRNSISYRAYGVERQEVRRSMLLSFTRSVLLLFFAIIIFTAYTLVGRDTNEITTPEMTPEVGASPTKAIRSTQTPSGEDVTQQSSPADPLPNPTVLEVEAPVVTPMNTLTVTPTSAVASVNSVNGLWLRSFPDPESETLELLIHESELIILPGREPTGQPEWQQVRAPSGAEGWVFIEYILYQ